MGLEKKKEKRGGGGVRGGWGFKKKGGNWG